MKPEKYKIDEVANALRKSNGFISQAALLLKCDASTIHNYINKYPELKEAVNEIRDKMLDFAEGKLYENIKENKEASIFFYLKTQGKRRGYIEKQEIEHSGNITINLIPPNKK